MKLKKHITCIVAMLSITSFLKLPSQTANIYCINYNAETTSSSYKYTVNTLSESTDIDSKYASHTHKYAIDIDDNELYYIIDQIIYKVDIESGASEIFMDFTNSSTFSLHGRLIYNSFDKNVYCFARRNDENILFNLSNQKYNKCYSAHYFTSYDKVISISGNYGYNTKPIHEFDLSTGKTVTDGYIRSHWYHDYMAIPFLHDESYYWIDFGGPKGAKPHIVYTNKLSWDDNSDYFGEYIGYFDGIAATTYNNEAYIMKEDFSIYKVNIEKLWEVHEILSDPDHPLNNTLTGEPAVSYEDALQIYINSNEIKQTGINNINAVADFKFCSDGSVILYDSYDMKYKSINHIKQIEYGDANCDGAVLLNDAVLVMQSIGNPDAHGVNGSEKSRISQQGTLNADVYNTGDSLTNMDALTIQRYLLGIIPQLPITQ